jgi:hypothetical protein
MHTWSTDIGDGGRERSHVKQALKISNPFGVCTECFNIFQVAYVMRPKCVIALDQTKGAFHSAPQPRIMRGHLRGKRSG